MEDVDPAFELALRYRAKAALRQRARALRNSIPRGAAGERSARIAARVEALPCVAAAGAVALFWPIEGRNEVDLTAVDARLRALHKRVAYPSIDPETRVMTFRFVDDPEAMEERGLGFREPSPDAPEATSLDVVVVPALQIDGRGHRIGYGAGFYDRTLPRFCPPAVSVGVAFSFQLILEVPVTEGDVAVALIVTDEQILAPERDAV
jgi:5-formyltetrahydrofolate cyclo-ligase